MPLRSRRPPLTFGVYEGERGDVPAPIKLFAGGFSGLLVEIDDFEHVSSRPWGRNSYPTLFVSLEWLFPLRRSIDSHRGFWQRSAAEQKHEAIGVTRRWHQLQIEFRGGFRSSGLSVVHGSCRSPFFLVLTRSDTSFEQ